METESETMARIQAKARTQRSREKAYEVWRTNGRYESVMLAILESLFATIDELENGKR